jgi:Zn-dependent metalloprotease
VAETDVDQAYDLSGITYDYFLGVHGRDSYDNAGGVLRSSVRYGVDYRNAYWDGQQMVYGAGYTSADDVVAHELTHAVTERTANLFYYNQSGALNESFSDIFGEVVDLTDGIGNDAPAARWQIAEDLPIGVIRDMMTPTAHGDPGRMSDSEFVCRSRASTDPAGDNGGVHHNSGIPNHAFALMADGGVYNGRTVTGIGLAKAAQVQYRALTVYLTSGATFADNARALAQACTDLTGTGGLTAFDCAQIATAVDAVEMTSPWACSGAPPSPPPAFCPVGESRCPTSPSP